AIGESPTLVRFQRGGECFSPPGRHARPDAAAEARPEGGRRDRAERAGRGDESERFGDWLAEKARGAGLRARDGVAERSGVPRLESPGGRRHEDLALLEKLLEAA